MCINKHFNGQHISSNQVVEKLTKSCPAVVAFTSSGAMYSIVPQNENARYVCTYHTQQLQRELNKFSKQSFCK